MEFLIQNKSRGRHHLYLTNFCISTQVEDVVCTGECIINVKFAAWKIYGTAWSGIRGFKSISNTALKI